MNWIKLTDENIPNIEVLAYGYQGEMLLGYISNNGHGEFKCENDHELLEEVTHFCFKVEPKD